MKEAPEANKRSQRIADQIRTELTSFLQGQAGDPHLGKIVVTDVEMNKDLSVARVGVRVLLAGESDPAPGAPHPRDVALRHLRRAATRIRRELAPRLNLRRMPELRFAYDASREQLDRLEQVLREIREEESKRQ